MNHTLRGLLVPGSSLLALGLGLLIGRNTVLRVSPGPSPGKPGAASRLTRSVPGRPHGSDPPRRIHPGDGNGSFNGSPEERKDQALVALSNVLNTSNRIERSRLLLTFLDNLDDGDLENVVDGFREAGWIDYNRDEYAMLISAWMNRDPTSAITYIDQNEPDGWTRKTAISAWAVEDPKAAAKAISGLDDGGRVNDWIVGLIQGMARNDPDDALFTLQKLPPGATRRQAIREMLPEVVTRGTDYAGEWIEQIDEPKLQRETAKNLAHSLARRDAELASDWIMGMSAGDSRRDASEIVAEIYASQDLDGARNWAESLPQDTLTEAAEGVAKHMARRDPVEAAQWLQKLGSDPDLDGARMQFLREAGKSDPQVALENVPNLSEASQQERFYKDILHDWSLENKEAAIAWAVENSESIPPDVLHDIVPND